MASKRLQEPRWVKKVPARGSHGSGALQKRLWRLVSDYVRIRDWTQYGRCVATGEKIENWRDGDAGHWKSYGVCRGIFKFDPMNIHLQSKHSNGWGGQEVGHKFGEELKRRYGRDILDLINKGNAASSLRFSNQDIYTEMESLISEMGKLPIQPDYYDDVVAAMV